MTQLKFIKHIKKSPSLIQILKSIVTLGQDIGSYDENKAYAIGNFAFIFDVATGNTSVYKCIKATTGPFKPADWTNNVVSTDIVDGTLSEKGVVQLSSAIDSTSEELAATPKAVKAAYEMLNSNIEAVQNVTSLLVPKAIPLTDTTDLDTVITSGFYRLSGTHPNMPDGGNAYGQLIVSRGQDTIAQITIAYTDPSKFYVRSGNPTDIGGIGVWKPWVRMATTDSPALTGTPTGPTATADTRTQQLATTEFVKVAIDNLINGAPGALDTLLELAEALDNDPNFATTITNLIATKAPTDSPVFTGPVTLGAEATEDSHAISKGYIDTIVAEIGRAGASKLVSHTFTLGQATAAQRKFIIPLDSYDSTADTLIVYIGSVYAAPTDYTITNTSHTDEESGGITRGYFVVNSVNGVDEGTSVDIIILKNVRLAENEIITINGALLEIGSVPIDRVQNVFDKRGGTVTGPVVSTVPNGTAPFVVASKTKVVNLDVDTVDGYHLNQGVQTSDSPEFAGATVGTLNVTGKLVIPRKTSDPISPEIGETWFRADL